MVHFTTTLSYGLRFLVNLALEKNLPKQLEKIAKEESISVFYLRKIIPPLEKAGLIKSLKGPGGGFILHRKPSEISLLEVVGLLSKNKLRQCLKIPHHCKRYDDCLVRGVWKEVYQAVQTVFKNKTLETIVKGEMSVS